MFCMQISTIQTIFQQSSLPVILKSKRLSLGLVPPGDWRHTHQLFSWFSGWTQRIYSLEKSSFLKYSTFSLQHWQGMNASPPPPQTGHLISKQLFMKASLVHNLSTMYDHYPSLLLALNFSGWYQEVKTLFSFSMERLSLNRRVSLAILKSIIITP